jgi:hypothetical protein
MVIRYASILVKKILTEWRSNVSTSVKGSISQASLLDTGVTVYHTSKGVTTPSVNISDWRSRCITRVKGLYYPRRQFDSDVDITIGVANLFSPRKGKV